MVKFIAQNPDVAFWILTVQGAVLLALLAFMGKHIWRKVHRPSGLKAIQKDLEKGDLCFEDLYHLVQVVAFAVYEMCQLMKAQGHKGLDCQPLKDIITEAKKVSRAMRGT
ncbi:MAG: hypothetical protein KQI62_02305 [Deltaproteobacteria bacterium]|nr:hypothetical protein [Deltaproteobacteria bacterium]